MFSTIPSVIARAFPLDSDVRAFIIASGITDPVTIFAINNLVIGLKTNGLWTKMSAIYPMAGTTATTQKWNLKDPRDLDAAFRLSFIGGWTHTSAGATPNGTNGYANTFLTPSSTLTVNSTHLSVYLNTNNAPPYADPVEIGCFNSVTRSILLQQAIAATLLTRNLGGVISGAQSGRTGFGITSKTSATVTTLYKNGLSVASGNSGGTLPTLPIFIGTMNYLGSPFSTGWTNNTIAFSSIGSGLTDAEALTLTSLVQRYLNTLSRSAVAIPTVQDIDAQNFLVAAVITDNTQANAIQNLVAGLKSNSLWTKMQAIYPFIGSTSTTQKFNLKSPYDTDAAFRLVFNGGWTHSSTGALPNGTNAYADTKYIASTSSNLTSSHFSIYSRTAGAGAFQNELGVANSDTQRMILITRWTTNALFADLFSVNQRVTIATAPTTTGLFTVSRNTSSEMIVYRNGSQIGINTATDGAAALPTIAAYLSAFNNAGTPANFSSKQLAFATIGSSLTSTDAANLYTLVQAYQTLLSRQV